MNKYYIKILTKSHAGTVSRLLSLFASRGISIDTINSGDEVGSNCSRVVLGIMASKSQLEIICHQIERLYDTISVTLYNEDALEVEALIIKLKATAGILDKLCNILAAQTIEVISHCQTVIVLGKIGTASQLGEARKQLAGFEIIEEIHTGATVIAKN
ncbi:MAG: hypothetical protein ACRC6X_01925 [Culicoidibacterales bacterium]